MNKSDLIDALQAQLGVWESALSKVDPAVVGTEEVEGYYSVKDLVAHVMANTRWMGAQIKGLVTGTPATPPELYGRREPPQLESFHFEHVNRSIYEQYRDAPFDSVLSDFRSVWSDLIWSTQSASEEILDQAAPWGGPPIRVVLRGITEHADGHLTGLNHWIEARMEGT